LPRFDRADRLARDTRQVSQLALRNPTLGAGDLQAVFQTCGFDGALQ
jgi:hypothetical protein